MQNAGLRNLRGEILNEFTLSEAAALRRRVGWLIGLLALSGVLGACGEGAAPSSSKSPAYRIGQQLNAEASPAAGMADYPNLTWDQLVPEGWKPKDPFAGMDINQLGDADPRAKAALARLRELWANAPAVPELNGRRVRMAGFSVPLEGSRDEVTEFLLVPYFGGCIHTPPPPGNQVVLVAPRRPVPRNIAMGGVWVAGTLRTETIETDLAAAAYHMDADLVEAYQPMEDGK